MSLLNQRLLGAIGLSAVGGLVLGACSFLASGLNPSQQRALDAHECYAAALEPVVGELAPEFLRAALAGGDLTKALIVHGVRLEDVLKASSAFEACSVQAVVPSEDPAANTDS